MKYAISVVVLTYNSVFDDIKKTILSIIKQKDIDFEIILADDGSKENHFKKIKELFKEYSFINYQFIDNKKNCGTCQNLYNAIEVAKGEFVKPISPQDLLYNETTLLNWYKFMKENNIQVSFGEAIYYIRKNSLMSIIQRESTQPTHKKLYDIDNYETKQILIDNLILNDCILGASYLCDRMLLKKYLKRIIGKVRLCEDFSYRIMLLDDIKIYSYNIPVIYYCYGTGVSSKKKSNGRSILSDDETAFRIIVSQMKYNNKFKMKIVKFLNNNVNNRYINRIISFIYFPKAFKILLENKVLKKTGRVKTIINDDYKFLKDIGVNKYIENN